MTRDEALRLVDQIIDLDIPYVAFGGGEPMGVPHWWDICERLSAAGILIKLETNGRYIDNSAATRLHQLGVSCIQISLDGASVPTHQRIPGVRLHRRAWRHRSARRPRQPATMGVRANATEHLEMVPAFKLAVRHGCSRLRHRPADAPGPRRRFVGRAGLR